MVGKACNMVTTVFDLIDNPLSILHLYENYNRI